MSNTKLIESQHISISSVGLRINNKIEVRIKDKSNLINDTTVFGCVFSDVSGKYAIKFVRLGNRGAHDEFLQEAMIGANVPKDHAIRIFDFGIIENKKRQWFRKQTNGIVQDIDKFLQANTYEDEWTKPAAYQRDHSWGIYIMEHFKQNKNEEALSLRSYFKKYQERNNACPSKFHPVYKKFAASLKAFYKSGYYHGDLHTNNVVVIIDITNGYDLNEVKAVKLFDYGMTQRVKVNSKSCLGSMLSKIDSDFKKLKTKNGKNMFRGLVVKWLPGGGGLRSNKNMIVKMMNGGRNGNNIKGAYLLNAGKTTPKKKTPTKTENKSVVRKK